MNETKFQQLERLHNKICGTSAESKDVRTTWGHLLQEHKLVASVVECVRCGTQEELDGAIRELVAQHEKLEVPA